MVYTYIGSSTEGNLKLLDTTGNTVSMNKHEALDRFNTRAIDVLSNVKLLADGSVKLAEADGDGLEKKMKHIASSADSSSIASSTGSSSSSSTSTSISPYIKVKNVLTCYYDYIMEHQDDRRFIHFIDDGNNTEYIAVMTFRNDTVNKASAYRYFIRSACEMYNKAKHKNYTPREISDDIYLLSDDKLAKLGLVTIYKTSRAYSRCLSCGIINKINSTRDTDSKIFGSLFKINLDPEAASIVREHINSVNNMQCVSISSVSRGKYTRHGITTGLKKDKSINYSREADKIIKEANAISNSTTSNYNSIIEDLNKKSVMTRYIYSKDLPSEIICMYAAEKNSEHGSLIADNGNTIGITFNPVVFATKFKCYDDKYVVSAEDKGAYKAVIIDSNTGTFTSISNTNELLIASGNIKVYGYTLVFTDSTSRKIATVIGANNKEFEITDLELSIRSIKGITKVQGKVSKEQYDGYRSAVKLGYAEATLCIAAKGYGDIIEITGENAIDAICKVADNEYSVITM